MSRVVRFAVLVLLVAGLVVSGARHAWTAFQRRRGHSVTIATFNVQTLFDGEYDGGEFREFNPYASEWNDAAYRERLEILATYLRELTPDGQPDILALQELEGPDVLSDLCEHIGGDAYPYRLCAPGEAVMSVCIASRFPVTAAVVHGLDAGTESAGPGAVTLRSMLDAAIDTPGGPVRVIAAHWKSPGEGRAETAALRWLAARAAARAVHFRLRQAPGSRIILAGDLNEEISPGSMILGPRPEAALRVAPVSAAPGSAAPGSTAPGSAAPVSAAPGSAAPGRASALSQTAPGDPPTLYSPWSELDGGSYVFRGRPRRIDHLLFTPGFFPGLAVDHADRPHADGPHVDRPRGGLIYGSAHLVTDWADETGAPARYHAFARRGVSDHFALYAVLQLK